MQDGFRTIYTHPVWSALPYTVPCVNDAINCGRVDNVNNRLAQYFEVDSTVWTSVSAQSSIGIHLFLPCNVEAARRYSGVRAGPTWGRRDPQHNSINFQVGDVIVPYGPCPSGTGMRPAFPGTPGSTADGMLYNLVEGYSTSNWNALQAALTSTTGVTEARQFPNAEKCYLTCCSAVTAFWAVC